MTPSTSTCSSLLVLCTFAAVAAAEPRYVGVRKCRTCHKKELIGNQEATWRSGPHAQAWETLVSQASIDLAGRLGVEGPPQQTRECLGCHTTAFGLAEERVQYALEREDGVQCESCHGPGSNYRKKKIMSDPEEAHARGLWYAEKDVKICTQCHNEKSPTFDPARFVKPDGTQAAFDFEIGVERIAHPIPPEVKGRYLELDEERKRAEKEKQARDEE